MPYSTTSRRESMALLRLAAAAGGTCLHLADLAANTLVTAVCLSLSGWRSGDGPRLRVPQLQS